MIQPPPDWEVGHATLYRTLSFQFPVEPSARVGSVAPPRSARAMSMKASMKAMKVMKQMKAMKAAKATTAPKAAVAETVADGREVADDAKLNRMLGTLKYNAKQSMNTDKQQLAKQSLQIYECFVGNDSRVCAKRREFLSAFEAGGKGKDGFKFISTFNHTIESSDTQETGHTENMWTRHW